ncbi:MAG: glycosyltransferase family A protein [Massilia sp.]
MNAPLVDVLVPTRNRPCALAMTLTALAAQSVQAIRIIVSDQSDDEGVFGRSEVLAVLRFLAAVGRPVATVRHMPRLGMAEHRAFLLSLVTAPCCLFLDDDVLIEPDLISRSLGMLALQQCGFVGSAVHGLSYLAAERPHEQHIEFWEGLVEPETITPASPAWQRHHLHSAANLYHVQQRLGLNAEHQRAYRVAWVGGCVLFDTAKLRAVGGFDFWPELPTEHCGEDVLAQLRVMARFGGCGVIPSGAYHMELPTTVTTRRIDAPKVLAARPSCGCGVDVGGALNTMTRPQDCAARLGTSGDDDAGAFDTLDDDAVDTLGTLDDDAVGKLGTLDDDEVGKLGALGDDDVGNSGRLGDDARFDTLSDDDVVNPRAGGADKPGVFGVDSTVRGATACACDSSTATENGRVSR